MAKILIGRKLDASTDSVLDKAKLIPAQFDFVDILARNASGDPTSIEYRTGGSSGTVVATLTITYDGSGDLKTVTRV